MATFKVCVLSGNKRKDGSMPIVIQLTHNRQRRYIQTPHMAFRQQLDRNGNIKDKNLKLTADGIYRRVKEILDALSFRVAAYSPDELKEHVTRKIVHAGEGKGIDFFDFADKRIEKLRAQGGYTDNYRVMLNNLARFLGERRLPAASITSHFLYKYQDWMRERGGANGKPLGERGQALYLVMVRALLNDAQRTYNDYENDDIPLPNRPFERFKIKQAKPLKTAEEKALSVEQIKAVRDYAPKQKLDELARDTFMLSFYLCGMNSVDLMRCSELMSGGVVRYYRSKVTERRGDKAEMRVRVEPEAVPLLEKYRGEKNVFCFGELYGARQAFSCALNRGLKVVGAAVGIDDLEFYYARHSWATIAANTCGIPIDTVEECLAHSDGRLAKRVYIKKDWEKIYAANRKVLDAIR
jgi:integrase